jgi:hypothetical protein
MERKDKFGIWNLAAKSFAVLSASLSALASSEAKAMPLTSNFINIDKNLSYNSVQKRVLKPKLILKLNIENPEKSYASMHTSHSSHASHASYSPPPGHASHSSHMSSSPSYAPSNPAPAYTPQIPVYTPNEPSNTSKENLILDENVLDVYSLGSRVLYKGCKGTDVKELQIILIKLGYQVSPSGSFDKNTESAVKKFQYINQLKVDGKVGSTTLIILQSK